MFTAADLALFSSLLLVASSTESFKVRCFVFKFWKPSAGENVVEDKRNNRKALFLAYSAEIVSGDGEICCPVSFPNRGLIEGVNLLWFWYSCWDGRQGRLMGVMFMKEVLQ